MTAPTLTRQIRRHPRGPRFQVFVTEEHIEHSIKRSSSHCMTAMAIRDVMPEATSISVDLQTIRFSLPSKGYRYTYLTPRISQVALIKYDQEEKPGPHDFWLAGAHVTRMKQKKIVNTPRGKELTDPQKDSINKMQSFTPGSGKAKLVSGKGGEIRRFGGRPPPNVPFAKRRGFGLRGLKL